jgi:hypothetical protein
MKFEKKEVEMISEKYEANISFIKKIAIFGLIVCGILAFVPLGIFGRGRREGISVSLIEEFGFIPAFLVVLGIVSIVCLIFYLINIPNLRKDLEMQEKVIGKVKVNRIEHLSPKLAMEMEGNKDTILHFEPNDFGIKTFYFNKSKTPHFLSARFMEIERAKYSKIEFKNEILE